MWNLRVTSRSKEVETCVYPSVVVRVQWPLHLQFLLKICLKLLVNVVNDWLVATHKEQHNKWHSPMEYQYFRFNSRFLGKSGLASSLQFILHFFQYRTFGNKWPRIPDFNRSDVLPVTQPTVSKHWKKHKSLTSTSGLNSFFLHPSPDSLISTSGLVSSLLHPPPDSLTSTSGLASSFLHPSPDSLTSTSGLTSSFLPLPLDSLTSTMASPHPFYIYH